METSPQRLQFYALHRVISYIIPPGNDPGHRPRLAQTGPRRLFGTREPTAGLRPLWCPPCEALPDGIYSTVVPRSGAWISQRRWFVSHRTNCHKHCGGIGRTKVSRPFRCARTRQKYRTIGGTKTPTSPSSPPCPLQEGPSRDTDMLVYPGVSFLGPTIDPDSPV